MDTSVSESIPKSHSIEEGISECMIMKDTIRMAALALIANTSSCLNEKIDEAEAYVVEIYVLSSEAVDAIKGIKAEGDECMKNVDGIADIYAAIACIATASAKGSLVVGKTIPAVSLSVAQLLTEIATLQVSVTLCMPKNALLTLGEEAEAVIVTIKDCIKEKLEKPSEESSEEDEEEEEQIIEEQSHNEVVDKHPEVQPPTPQPNGFTQSQE